MLRGDPTDERLYRRTTVGFIASLLLHLLAAFLFFTLATTSSEQSASESVEGSPLLVSVQQAAPAKTKSATTSVQAPRPHAPRVAPARGKPALAGHKAVPTHRELAKNTPHAPPNPTPAPLAPFSPNPAPSAVALFTPQPAPLPAVPVSIPSIAPAISQKLLVTPQPSPAPTAPPTAKPATPAPASTVKPLPKSSARPSAAPSAAPTKAPAPAATAAPSKAPATPGPIAQQAPVPKASAAGIHSPAPTGAATPSVQHGANPSPGPRALASSGPLPGPRQAKPQPSKPVALPPTPSPAPAPPRPRATKTPSSRQKKAAADLNARLKGLLPNNPVNPAQAHYQIDTSRLGHNQDPTPPPEVLAHTKFIYRSRGSREDRVIMYVTDATKHGLFTTCKGWLVRFPSPPGPYRASIANSPVHADRNTGVIVDNPGPRGEAGFMPIIEPDASFLCESGRLEPFVPPGAASSPAP